MNKIVNFDKNIPHKTSIVICLVCLHRWVAVRPKTTHLKDFECPKCHQQGYVIETGEIIDGDGDGTADKGSIPLTCIDTVNDVWTMSCNACITSNEQIITEIGEVLKK